MKTFKILLLSFIAMLLVSGGNSIGAEITKSKEAKTKVYYFHNTRRCPTCMAIEKETKKVLNEKIFAEARESGELEFKSFNAEKGVNKKLIKELGVTGSALIVIKDGKKTDLTNKGFMYGLRQPEKLREALRNALNN